MMTAADCGAAVDFGSGLWLEFYLMGLNEDNMKKDQLLSVVEHSFT